MKTSKLINIIIIIIYFVFLSVFFGRLFHPEFSVFMIPDFGLSDVLHLNLPLKYFLSESLKANEWPLWNQNIGTGFPVLAEGQIGTFYLLNLILFKFLPFVLAYNISLLFIFCTSFVGFYIFTKSMKFSSTASLVGSLIFSFSGYFSVHLNHFNLIQTLSMMPFVFWSFKKLIEKSNYKNSILLSFLISQQIFAGHFYITFITIIGILLYLIIRLIHQRNFRITFFKYKIIFIIISLIFTLGLAAIQLFPTFELWKESTRNQGLDFQSVTAYPYPIRHLITFIFPYYFGSPQNGSYPAFQNDWGIFWENTAYIGIFPFIAAISVLFFKTKKIKPFIIIFFLSLLLVFGKYSPIYFLFSLPPFNFFRVPSKYIILTFFSLVILFVQFIDLIFEYISKLKLKYASLIKVSIYLLIFVSFLDIFNFSYNYPPVSKFSFWLTPSKSLKYINNNDGRILSVGAIESWNEIFLNKGWLDISQYESEKNYLMQNYNIFFDIKNTNVYTGGLIPNKLSYFSRMINTIDIDKISKVASLSAISKNAINFSHTKYLISRFDITEKEYKKIQSISTNNKDYNIYENSNAFPRSYISYNSIYVKTYEDIIRLFDSDINFNSPTVLVLDKKLETSNYDIKPTEVKINKSTHNNIQISASTDITGFLVLADSYYPGWNAFVNGVKSEILTVNLNQRAILIEKGNNIIEFKYIPKYFEIGKVISEVSMITAFLTLFLSQLFCSYKYRKNNLL